MAHGSAAQAADLSQSGAQAAHAGDFVELDRRLVLATQGGLPLVPRPYAAVAEVLGVDEALVCERLAAMLADGRIRRIGAVPNHYAIGYTANGMSVWDVDDAVIDAVREEGSDPAAVADQLRTVMVDHTGAEEAAQAVSAYADEHCDVQLDPPPSE